MLTHRVPCPPDRGDRIRAYHLLTQMAKRFNVTLATVAHEPMSDATRHELDRLTSDCLWAPADRFRQRTAAAGALFRGNPITPSAMMDRGLAKRVVALHQRRPFEVVFTYCTGMIGYTQALYEAARSGRVKPFRHVLDLVDVDSLKWAGYAESSRGPMRLVYALEARRLRAVEAGGVVPFDALTVISQAEARRYRASVSAAHQPVVVGNGVDLERFHPAQARRPENATIIFTGVMSYKPNVDAAVWFARRVMPRVRAAVPEARFAIVGKSPAPAVVALGELPGVEVVGPVDDTAEHLRAAALAVAPMMIAPGVQNKVLEAMACGRAVVCSSAAASGIDAEPREEFIVADTEPDVAAQCARLLMNPVERDALGRAARRCVESRYHWAAAVAPMMGLLDPTTSLSMHKT